ncbi:MAG: CHAT domain-containing protein, partial [Methylocystaceae bacterium]|nr:CHAT domain-containing protein [Methylocystaceae bacterium]
MELILQIEGSWLQYKLGDKAENFLELNGDVLSEMKSLRKRYQAIARNTDNLPLLSIGQELFRLIGLPTHIVDKWLENANRTLPLIIQSKSRLNETHRIILSLPWEILATDEGFLIEDAALFQIKRQIGPASNQPHQADFKDLNLAFMAAAPAQQKPLNYEAEETAIITAAGRNKEINLYVEESGDLDLLNDYLSDLADIDMLHLSCHGGINKSGKFCLSMEDHIGAEKLATIDDFERLSSHVRNLFISACSSATNSKKEYFIIELARSGFHNIVGWDGSVGDDVATEAAKTFYQAILDGSTPQYATSFARKKLYKQEMPYWHLLRSYHTIQGGNPLVDTTKSKHPKRTGTVATELLDKQYDKMPVASKEAFVGRRQQLKEALNYIYNDRGAGLLLTGMGGCGKSSFALRISDRLKHKYKSVVILEKYTNADLFAALLGSLEGEDQVKLQGILDDVQQSPDLLEIKLISLLNTLFSDIPILLIVDDLEQYILEKPKAGQENVVFNSEEASRFVRTLIRAFKAAHTPSKLLFTSRYKFTLEDDDGQNLSATLHNIEMPDMLPYELYKHWLVLCRINGKTERSLDQDEAYLTRIHEIGKGNSGLHAYLLTALLNDELTILEQALDAIDNYKTNKDYQNLDTDLEDYLKRIALETYIDALSETEKCLLQGLSLFDFPIPKVCVGKFGADLAIDDPMQAFMRLDNLGLVIHGKGREHDRHVSIIRLAKTIVEELPAEDKNRLAQAFSQVIWEEWFADIMRACDIPDEVDFDVKLKILKSLNNKFKEENISLFSEAVDLQRISLLQNFCIMNSPVDWIEIKLNCNTFIDLLEISIALNPIEKFRIGKTFHKLSTNHIKELFSIFSEEGKKFRELHGKHFAILCQIIQKHHEGRSDLYRKAFTHLVGGIDKDTLNLFEGLDPNDENGNLLQLIEIAKQGGNPERIGSAYANYAYFLSTKKQDYDKADEMYQRAIEADPDN